MDIPKRIRYKTAQDAASHLKVVVGVRDENRSNYTYALGDFYSNPACKALLGQVEAELTKYAQFH